MNPLGTPGRLGTLLCLGFLFVVSACAPSSKDPQKTAMERGIAFLKGIQRPDGAIADTVNPLFDTWETVAAATAIWQVTKDPTDSSLGRALDYLASVEDSAGMLCHNQKCRQAYCLETTSEYFLLLADLRGSSAILPRLDTILQLQLANGGWDIGNPDVHEAPGFPSVTGFVLRMLDKIGIKARQESAAINYLVGLQAPEGHWGAHWEYYGDPSYALWPISSQLPKLPPTSQSKAIEWLNGRARQLCSGTAPKCTAPCISASLEAALLLSAAQSIGCDSLKATRQDLAEFVIQQQLPNGAWDGGLFPIASERYRKEEYIFATSRCLVALVTNQAQSPGQP